MVSVRVRVRVRLRARARVRVGVRVRVRVGCPRSWSRQRGDLCPVLAPLQYEN